MNQGLILTFTLSLFVSSCSTEETTSISKEENGAAFEITETIIAKSDSAIFERSLIDLSDSIVLSLYDSLKKEFQIEFRLIDLQTLFKKVNIEQLTQGESFSNRFLIEEFECDCLDELVLSYDQSTQYFNLVINETIYVEGLDWCPEHTKVFGYQVNDGEIQSLNLLAEAG